MKGEAGRAPGNLDDERPMTESRRGSEWLDVPPPVVADPDSPINPDDHSPFPITRELIRQRIAELAVATAHPTTAAEFIHTATTENLVAELLDRGALTEEWFVALHARADTDPPEVLGRWVMSSEAQAHGVCRDWRDDMGANYVVERHLGAVTFTVVPAPSTG